MNLRDGRIRDTVVTSARAREQGDDAAARTLVAALASEIARLNMKHPRAVEGELQRHGLITRTRALGKTSNNTINANHEILINEIIEHTNTNLDLVRASLTIPTSKHEQIAPLMAAFARNIADADENHGALLVLDLRPKDHAPHAYAWIACSRSMRDRLAAEWCALTGADRAAHRGNGAIQTIGGWLHYARTGDDRILRRNLGHSVAYGLRDLPGEFVRDLDTDVAVSGALAGPWRAYREAERLSGRPTALSRLVPMAVAVTRACVVCGVGLGRMRADATTCSARCRQARSRERRRVAKNGDR